MMGMRHALSNRPLIVGRGEDVEIRVLDTSVSRRHARIEKIGDEYFVLDMQSTNGSYVNDRQSLPGDPIPMRDGDYVRVGNCIFRYLASGNVEADYHEEIYRLTIVDALTQIANARNFNEFLEREVLRTVRHGRPLSLVLFDIDRFKTVNDQLGHLGGDFTLRELAACVKKVVRREDLFARYGGEEFALVLIETGQKEAVLAAERIRQLVVVESPAGNSTCARPSYRPYPVYDEVLLRVSAFIRHTNRAYHTQCTIPGLDGLG